MAGPRFFDRVQASTTTTGTGTYTLGGATTGYQAWSVLSNADTAYYMATDGVNWEVGLGTYTTAGTTLARTTVLASSNSGSAVSWSAGTKTVSLVEPALLFNGLVNSGTAFSPNASAGLDLGTGALPFNNLFLSGVITSTGTVGMTLLGTLTTTSGTTQSLTGIPAGYRFLYFEFENIGFSAGAILTLATSIDNSTYGTAIAIAPTTSSSGGRALGTAMLFGISTNQSSNQNAKSVQAWIRSGGVYTPTNAVVAATADGVITAVQFAGGTFASGVIRIYGAR